MKITKFLVTFKSVYIIICDHIGMGLPLAKKAMSSMGGSVTLGPREEGGAKFEFRWPIRKDLLL